MNVLVDTNIALYLLSGSEGAARVLDRQTLHVSFVTELVLLGFAGMDDAERRAVEAFLSDCEIVDISAAVKRETIALRRSTRLKLPDATVGATAIVGRMPLVSADREFARADAVPLILYEP